jgi:hypothetical protein
MDEAEVATVCWDHPLAFMKGPVEAVSDPRIVTLILLGSLAVIYLWIR